MDLTEYIEPLARLLSPRPQKGTNIQHRGPAQWALGAESRCQAKPPQLHGPYYQWTRKLRGKTVTVRLTEEEAEHIREWVENGRKLDRIVAEMEKLSLRMTDRLLRQLKPA